MNKNHGKNDPKMIQQKYSTKNIIQLHRLHGFYKLLDLVTLLPFSKGLRLGHCGWVVCFSNSEGCEWPGPQVWNQRSLDLKHGICHNRNTRPTEPGKMRWKKGSRPWWLMAVLQCFGWDVGTGLGEVQQQTSQERLGLQCFKGSSVVIWWSWGSSCAEVYWEPWNPLAFFVFQIRSQLQAFKGA